MRRSLALLIGLALTGCNLNPAPGALLYGKVKINAKADRAQADSILDAELPIREVQIRRLDGSYFTFLDENFEIDLAQLGQGLTVVLGRAQIPDGEYDSIRLITDGPGLLTLSDGSQYNLIVPSGDETGIKVFLDTPLSIVHGLIAQVDINIDLSQSFVETAQDWHFKPVVRPVISFITDPDPEGDQGPADDGSNADGSTSDGTTDAGGVTTPPVYPVIGS